MKIIIEVRPVGWKTASKARDRDFRQKNNISKLQGQVLDRKESQCGQRAGSKGEYDHGERAAEVSYGHTLEVTMRNGLIMLKIMENH